MRLVITADHIVATVDMDCVVALRAVERVTSLVAFDDMRFFGRPVIAVDGGKRQRILGQAMGGRGEDVVWIGG